MRSGRERFEESLERASRLNLEGEIRALAKNDAERRASPRQIDRRRSELLSRYRDPLAANRQLERVLKGNDLTDISYLLRGLLAARSVGRVVIQERGRVVGYGTGFLVAPGVLMTNEHVLTTRDEVDASVLELDYERDLSGNERRPKRFDLLAQPEPLIVKELDFTLCAVSAVADHGVRLSDYGWLKLKPSAGKAFVGEYLTIVQHPGGEPKQVCVRENKLLKNDENSPYLWYQTDTSGGSSGSPVFNNDWEVVGLHHSSVPRTKLVKGKQTWFALNGEPWTSDMGDDSIDWLANEGIRISRIVDYLRRQASSHPLAQALLDAPESPQFAAGPDQPWNESVTTEYSDDGILRVRVPIQLGIRVGVGPVSNGPAQGAVNDRERTQRTAARSITVSAVEKVEIDQTTYKKRNGYEPKFLGAGTMVRLPTVTGATKKGLFQSGGSPELKYWNYSVLFSSARKLALVSAANVDPGQWRGNRDAEGDTWFNDTRVPDEVQLGRDFYKKQAKFEADRSKNPFDQGHLTRRKDLQWGVDDKTAKRNGDDSYHYTNCSPQHWAFNQNSKVDGIWFRLEEFAAEASDGERFCVFNGPLFDAPLCREGSDGRLVLAPKGKRVKDGTFGGVRIPRQFFKVIVYRVGKKLKHAAFIVTQEELLGTIDRFQDERTKPWLSDAEVRLYQVPLSVVKQLSGLDFGNLGSAQAGNGQEEGAPLLGDGAPIEDPAELRF